MDADLKREKARWSRIKRVYGITQEEYNELDKGHCPICLREWSEKVRPAVDHDHVDGWVRGVICLYCNRVRVGRFRDHEIVQRIADYLKQEFTHKVPPKPKKEKEKEILNHIMLDLETLDNHSHSPIIAVGAQAFNKEGLLSAYYTKVDLEGQAPVGADTLRWWLKTDSNLLNELLTGRRLKIVRFLRDFSGWVYNIRDESPDQKIGMWGNASVFDNVILGNAYKRFNIKTPWTYQEDKCYRTVRNIFPDVEMDTFEGTQHDPLDDAIFQVNHLLKIHKQKGFVL